MTQVPTKRGRLVEYVRQAIDQGRYQPGERLPSEAEFGRLLECSRITVRNALTELAHHGRVEARHGKGWYVRFDGRTPQSTTPKWITLTIMCCGKLTTGETPSGLPDLPEPGTLPVDTSEEVAMSGDHRDDQPVYKRIADEIRQEIVTGGREGGSKLPSEGAISANHGVSRVTARRALAVLASWGLIETIKGKGTFVRTVPPVMRMGHERFSRADRMRGKGAFAAEAERLGLSWAQEDLELATIGLISMVADVLGEPRAVVKRRLMWLDGEPNQLADSYVPESIALKMGYHEGATAPGGLYGLLEQHGHMITWFREEIRARVATPEEASALMLPDGAPVAALVRVAYDQDNRPVEYFDSVAVGDKYCYVYKFDAPSS